METKKLAIFDFDGTITSKDTMVEFIRFTKGNFLLYLSFVLLAFWLIPAKLGIFGKENAKKRLLSFHFKGSTHSALLRKGDLFCREILPSLLREKALDQIQFHRQHKHDLMIITASLDFWVEPWLKHQNLNYICTKAEFIDEKFTGNFMTPNCSGAEKVRRLKEVLDPAQYVTIFAYGDSAGDKSFLNLAHKRFYKPFRKPVHKSVV